VRLVTSPEESDLRYKYKQKLIGEAFSASERERPRSAQTIMRLKKQEEIFED